MLSELLVPCLAGNRLPFPGMFRKLLQRLKRGILISRCQVCLGEFVVEVNGSQLAAQCLGCACSKLVGLLLVSIESLLVSGRGILVAALLHVQVSQEGVILRLGLLRKLPINPPECVDLALPHSCPACFIRAS